MSPEFKYYDLQLCHPSFNSNLTDLIIELDYLRRKPLKGSTHPKIFFQLKKLFHTLESIGSARIEGNRTTIAEFIETKLDKIGTNDEKILEIQNIEKAMDFIDEHVRSYAINRIFVSELHKIVVDGLSPEKEGDKTAGIYRMVNVKISSSNHLPPDYMRVNLYMDELFNFIKENSSSKYDLLKAAIAHHRFVWIHPFANGNGRTVRLLTYAMLVKSGFNVHVGRIVNPTAIFCSDRNKYYNFLSIADTGKEQDTLTWCEYVLSGLKNEIEKIDKLLNYAYLAKNILMPALGISLERKVVTDIEAKILRIAINNQVFKAADVKEIFPNKIPAEISRMLHKLRDRGMIIPVKENTREYAISFNNNYLLRGVIAMLDKEGFLPIRIDEK